MLALLGCIQAITYPWEMDAPDDIMTNIEPDTLQQFQEIFVRFKGLYEGLYMGFYRNNDNLMNKDLGECLGASTYEDLDIIAKATDSHRDSTGNWAKDLMAVTAVVRLILDNDRYCNFDKMVMDMTTFCFINDCSLFKMAGNFATNWAEAVYSFNMIWTTVVSSGFTDYSLKNDY